MTWTDCPCRSIGCQCTVRSPELKIRIQSRKREILAMKVVSSIGSLKHRHPDCQVVRRRGRIYVICKSNPKLKVRQGNAKSKRTRR